MEKDKLLNQLNHEFEKIKKELGFKSKFEKIDEIFFIKDSVLKDGFVSDSFSRQLCHRMVETFMSWNNYLHGIIFPTPHYLISAAESKIFNDAEKKEISKLISEAMGLVSTNTLVGLNKDKKMEARFIDDSVKFWEKRYQPELLKVMKKVNEGWLKKDDFADKKIYRV